MYILVGCPDECPNNGLVNNRANGDFTGTSVLTNSEYHHARFNSRKAWFPSTNYDPNDYVQIDLGSVVVVCAVATKGNAGKSRAAYTTEYKISTSKDDTIWMAYTSDSSPKVHYLFLTNITITMNYQHPHPSSSQVELSQINLRKYNSFLHCGWKFFLIHELKLLTITNILEQTQKKA